MSWLKCTPIFKHGEGIPIYAYISDDEVAPPDLVDEMKIILREEHGDPEGYREPLWEIVEVPPKKVLQDNITEAERKIASYTKDIQINKQLLEKYYD